MVKSRGTRSSRKGVSSRHRGLSQRVPKRPAKPQIPEPLKRPGPLAVGEWVAIGPDGEEGTLEHIRLVQTGELVSSFDGEGKDAVLTVRTTRGVSTVWLRDTAVWKPEKIVR